MAPAPDQPVASTPLDHKSALRFIFAGNATFTLQSLKTGARFTYRVWQGGTENSPVWVVRVLRGNAYEHIGSIRGIDHHPFLLGNRLDVLAIRWFISRCERGKNPNNCELYHMMRCGRCGRPLTVPESIENGFGPDCAKLVQ